MDVAPPTTDLVGIGKVLRNVVKDSRFFLAGTCGGIAGVVAGQPFDTVKVRLQTASLRPSWHNANQLTVWECVTGTFMEQGVRGFYRGMSSPMLGVSLQKATAFGVFGSVKSALAVPGESQDRIAHVAIAGCAGGIANSFVLTPVDQLKICLQVKHCPTTEAPQTLREAARSIIEGGSVQATASPARFPWSASLSGIRGIYAAMPATLLREIPGYSLYFVTYELLSRIRRAYDATWAIPFVGGAAGVVMWASYYPLDMVKSRSMAQVATTALSPLGVARTKPLAAIFKQVYSEGGLSRFYVGAPPAIMRAFFTHGVIFMVYEAILSLTADE